MAGSHRIARPSSNVFYTMRQDEIYKRLQELFELIAIHGSGPCLPCKGGMREALELMDEFRDYYKLLDDGYLKERRKALPIFNLK